MNRHTLVILFVLVSFGVSGCQYQQTPKLNTETVREQQPLVDLEFFPPTQSDWEEIRQKSRQVRVLRIIGPDVELSEENLQILGSCVNLEVLVLGVSENVIDLSQLEKCQKLRALVSYSPIPFAEIDRVAQFESMETIGVFDHELSKAEINLLVKKHGIDVAFDFFGDQAKARVFDANGCYSQDFIDKYMS